MFGVLKKTLLAAAVFVITFALIEGLASEALLGYQLFLKPKPPLAERLHTRYDPELGWVGIPNLDIPDMYGPGLSFHSNGQGFRNDHDFAGDFPAHWDPKLRIPRGQVVAAASIVSPKY